MVAMKVESLPSHLICVITLEPSFVVSTVKPAGVLRLSGDTALATACAVFSSLYSSWILASKFFPF